MKKILTLFTMLAVMVSIVSAQSGPKINYQAVVRHTDASDPDNVIDTLYHDQTVDVTITIAKAGGSPVWYTGYYNGVPTTENGLLSIVIGVDDDAEGSLLDVDWTDNAVITTTIDLGIVGEDPVTFSVEVAAVPYAIQANIGPLTTEMIADYSENRITNAGMTQILDAIRNNPNGLKDGLKQMVIDYMKEHPEIAKEIISDYLHHYDAQNVREAYEALNTNALRPQLKDLLKQLLISSRPMAKDLALWFVSTATAYDIQRTYETIRDIPDLTQQAVWDNVAEYVTNPDNRVVMYDLGVYFIKNITAEQAGNAYNTLKTLNPDVKNDFRAKLDHYVDLYVSSHPGCTDVNLDPNENTAVDHAINNYIQENGDNLIPAPDCPIDVCALKALFDLVHP